MPHRAPASLRDVPPPDGPYTPRTIDLPVEVTPQEAHAAVAGGSAYLLDVREPWEWEARHIPGATLIPLVELPRRVVDLPDDRDIYVYCRTGRRNARAVAFLRRSGRPGAANVAGGIDDWEVFGLPLTR